MSETFLHVATYASRIILCSSIVDPKNSAVDRSLPILTAFQIMHQRTQMLDLDHQFGQRNSLRHSSAKSYCGLPSRITWIRDWTSVEKHQISGSGFSSVFAAVKSLSESERPYKTFWSCPQLRKRFKSQVLRIPRFKVPFTYLRVCLAACKCLTPSLCKHLDKNVTENPKSGLVHWYRYIKDPTMALYCSWTWTWSSESTFSGDSFRLNSRLRGRWVLVDLFIHLEGIQHFLNISCLMKQQGVLVHSRDLDSLVIFETTLICKFDLLTHELFHLFDSILWVSSHEQIVDKYSDNHCD